MALVLWLAWGISRVFGASAFNKGFPYTNIFPSNGDVQSYWQWSYSLWHGAIPYRDFNPTYPPGVLPVLGLPPFSFHVYRAEFLLAAMLVDALVFRALLRSDRRMGAGLWVLAAPLLGPIFWGRLDIFVAGMLVAAMLSFQRGRFGQSSCWLAAAGLVKLWPFLLVVLLIPLVPRHRRLAYAAGAAVTSAVAVVPFLALGGGSGLWQVLHIQTGRGVEFESLFATPLFLVQASGHSMPIIVHWAVEFAGPIDSVVSAISFALFAAGIAYCVWRSFFRPLPGSDPARWLLLVVVVVLTTDKVLSAQYFVWGAAAVALFIDQTRYSKRLFGVTCAVLFATQLQFPLGFYRMVLGTPEALPLSAFHAVVLVFFATIALIAVHEAPVPLQGDLVGADGRVAAYVLSRMLTMTEVEIG